MESRCRCARINSARVALPALNVRDLCFRRQQRKRQARLKPVSPEASQHPACFQTLTHKWEDKQPIFRHLRKSSISSLLFSNTCIPRARLRPLQSRIFYQPTPQAPRPPRTAWPDDPWSHQAANSGRLISIAMSDTLYLSLWYPNLRLAALPDKLTAVLGAFAAHGGERYVYAATVWPMSWSEAPVFQRVWGRATTGLEPRQAVAEAVELLHDDYAYEFQIGWSLWELEDEPALSSTRQPGGGASRDESDAARLDPRWVRTPRFVRVTGFGPLFDEGAYEQEGHVRIDFGADAPFLDEEAELDATGARHIEENVRQLVALAQAVEKDSSATARLLWSELGESLAQRLAARLGMRN